MPVHKTSPPPNVSLLRDWIDGALPLSESVVPKHIATGIRALTERPQPEDGRCHRDFTPAA
jgi:hypothetical protein